MKMVAGFGVTELSNGNRKWTSLDPLSVKTLQLSSQRVQPCVTVLRSISGRGSSATPAPAFAPVESAVELDLAGHDAKAVQSRESSPEAVFVLDKLPSVPLSSPSPLPPPAPSISADLH